MKPGGAFVTVLHSPMKFVAISEVTQHLQGRFVGFVGDRLSTKDPISIVLPQQKLWSWETKMVSSDAVALATHYDKDPTCRGKLWTPEQADSAGWTAVKAPLLLTIPLVLFQAIREEGKPLMPHEIHGLAMTIINSSADIAKARTDWDLILTWCILAAQQNTYGNSHLSLSVEVVTEGDDDYFEKWIDQQLNSTFGPRPGTGLVGHAGMGGLHSHMTLRTYPPSWPRRSGKGWHLACGRLVTYIGTSPNWEGATRWRPARGTPRTTSLPSWASQESTTAITYPTFGNSSTPQKGRTLTRTIVISTHE